MAAAAAAGTVTETPQRPTSGGSPRRFPLWAAFIPGAARGYRAGVAGNQAQQRIDLASRGMESQIGSQDLINKSRELGIREQEQKAILAAGGRFASLLRQGNMPGARQFLNKDDFIKRYFQVPAGSSMEFETFEDGSVHLYRQGPQGQAPESSMNLSREDLNTMFDRANPEAAKSELEARKARGELTRQERMDQFEKMALDMGIQKLEFDKTLRPFLEDKLQAQAETGAITAQGESAREPLRQSTLALQEANEFGDVQAQAGMRPDVRATERIGAEMGLTAAKGAQARQPLVEGAAAISAGQVQAGAQSGAILAAYQASLINPGEGLNMLRQTGIDQKFTKPVADIKIDKANNTITLVDAAGETLKYNETGQLAVFNKAQMDAQVSKGKWKGGEWGMLNDETGQYVLFDGKGTSGVLSPQRMAMIREMNKNIRSHFGGMYDQAMDKWTFVDKNGEQKAAEAMALGQELMFPGGYPLNSASQIAGFYAENYPGRAREQFTMDTARKAGQPDSMISGDLPPPTGDFPSPGRGAPTAQRPGQPAPLATTARDYPNQALRGSPAGGGSLAVGGTSGKGTTAGQGAGEIAQPGARPPAQPQTTGQTLAPAPPPAGAPASQAGEQDFQSDRENWLAHARNLKDRGWLPEKILEEIEKEMDQKTGVFGTDPVYPKLAKSQYEGFPNRDRQAVLDQVAAMLGVNREQEVSAQISPWNQPAPQQFNNSPRRMVAADDQIIESF